jgi:hypothetical protein
MSITSLYYIASIAWFIFGFLKMDAVYLTCGFCCIILAQNEEKEE